MTSITRTCHFCNAAFTVAQQSSRKRFCGTTCRSRNSRSPVTKKSRGSSKRRDNSAYLATAITNGKPFISPTDAPTVATPGISLVSAVEAKFQKMGRAIGAIETYLIHLARLLDDPAGMAGGALSSVGREFRATYAVILRESDGDEPDALDVAQAAVAAKRAELYRLRTEAQN